MVNSLFPGGVTWVYHNHPEYFYDMSVFSGNAHVAFLTNKSVETGYFNSTVLRGDTSAVLHNGMNQVFWFEDFNNYLPVNFQSYQ